MLYIFRTLTRQLYLQSLNSTSTRATYNYDLISHLSNVVRHGGRAAREGILPGNHSQAKGLTSVFIEREVAQPWVLMFVPPRW